MSKKKGFSILETRSAGVRLSPRARELAGRVGGCFNSSAAFRTRARVECLTTFKSLSTRETVAVETPAFFATAFRFMSSACLGMVFGGGNLPPSILMYRQRLLKLTGVASLSPALQARLSEH